MDLARHMKIMTNYGKRGQKFGLKSTSCVILRDILTIFLSEDRKRATVNDRYLCNCNGEAQIVHGNFYITRSYVVDLRMKTNCCG
jgi:hypothetical protein